MGGKNDTSLCEVGNGWKLERSQKQGYTYLVLPTSTCRNVKSPVEKLEVFFLIPQKECLAVVQ